MTGKRRGAFLRTSRRFSNLKLRLVSAAVLVVMISKELIRLYSLFRSVLYFGAGNRLLDLRYGSRRSFLGFLLPSPGSLIV
jgi:hypothetical protein